MRNAGLESRLLGEISITSDTQMTPPSEEELRSFLMKAKEESEKAGLKLNIQKTKIMASGLISSWKIDGVSMETVRDFIFLGCKITADSDCSHKIKRHLLLGRTFSTKAHLVKAMVFPVVMYGCESWTQILRLLIFLPAILIPAQHFS